ncbi:MAG: hypothetical protein VR68_08340 [Peptococcaceae bacterium BRH_c4a]|nr:MAG: hypothetical protein VR68_08340 [Peptococcaceae bacterium BRH_c4a]
MSGIKLLGSLISGLLTENFQMLLLAFVTFFLVCIIQFVSTMVFGQGEFAGGRLSGEVLNAIMQAK